MQVFITQADYIIELLQVSFKTTSQENLVTGNSYEAHLARVKQLAPQMLADLIAGLEIFLILSMLLRVVVELFWAHRQATKEKTSAAKFLSMSSEQKWFYTSFLSSYIYSILLVSLTIIAALSCQESSSQHANCLTSAYCRDNPTDL